eukprot:scaffold23834_cov158-Skeletonema_marinoi.AAC.3
MSYPLNKKQKQLTCSSASVVATAGLVDLVFDDLSTDELVNIFVFLSPEDIMRARLNRKMRDSAKKTIVPMTEFSVDSVKKYNAMAVMTTALPNLQQIVLRLLCRHGDLWLYNRYKYSDGEEPDESVAVQTADWVTHDIEIISNFKRLCILEIIYDAPLNGRYPFLFNFPLLQNLTVYSHYLKWDLEMLAVVPLLKELRCDDNQFLTGNINSLRVLKDTLELVEISTCRHVQGNFMDLANLPRLRVLYLLKIAVRGDVRDIGERDFLSLKQLTLPAGVYGGWGYKFQHISDAIDVARTYYLIRKQRSDLLIEDWQGELSEDSLNWYDSPADELGEPEHSPPFNIIFVQAGPRMGYRWQNAYYLETCEVNWLDPEPRKESNDYEKYLEELHKIEERTFFFRGFNQPPTSEQYHRLLEFEESYPRS